MCEGIASIDDSRELHEVGELVKLLSHDDRVRVAGYIQGLIIGRFPLCNFESDSA